MKTGIIGDFMSGKTTLFNALTGAEEAVGTGSKDIHIANVKVPDVRIDKLTEVYQPKRTVYAEINFVDFGGSFDSKTEGQTVSKIREMDCLAVVLGSYQTDDEKEIVKELNNILGEMVVLDFMIIERRIERMIKENKKDLEFQTLNKCKDVLENDGFLSDLKLSPEELKSIANYRFLTMIPQIVLINVADDMAGSANYPLIEDVCKKKNLEFMYISGSIEMEIAGLPKEDQKAFLEDLGLKESAKDRFIRKAYEKMDLIAFFTSGKDEVRAWTITRGSSAQKAAGKIHSDIEKGFIRAEVISYADFEENGYDEGAVKSAGKARLEGKAYTVTDGDIIVYRFNV
jgi:GTP-binding protein YchF